MHNPSYPALAFAGVASFALLALASCTETTDPDVAASPAPSAAQVAAGSWAELPDMPTARFRLAAAVVRNSAGQDVVYAIGGSSNYGSHDHSTVEAYNSATRRWKTVAPMLLARNWMNGAGTIGGKIYVTGGFHEEPWGQQSGRELQVYNPATNKWVFKANMPVSSALGVTGVINGKLYVLQGIRIDCDGCTQYYSRRLYRYTPSSNTWKRLADVPQRHAGGGGAVINSKFYVAGGHDSQNNPGGLDVYDPVTNTWTTKAAPPARLARGAAYAMLSERLHAMSSHTDMYNPATNKWSTKAPPNRPREDAAAAKVIVNGAPQIILMGGGSAEGFNYVDRYKP